MATFSALKTKVRSNLNDAGSISYTASDMDDSMQDAYDDIVCLTKCIIKKVTLSWIANLSYYDFKTLVPDYMAITAIFNNVNNRWLDDDRTVKDFDFFRDDWELATGTPTNWAPVNFQYTAMFPRYTTAAGTFDLYYWATADVILDTNTPVIATDCQKLLVQYSTMDLLEQFEEFVKANMYWTQYNEGIEMFKERIEKFSARDALQII